MAADVREESSACNVDAAEAAPLQCFHHPLKAQKEEAFLEHFLIDRLQHGKRLPVLMRLSSVLVIPNNWCSKKPQHNEFRAEFVQAETS
jgi:hypothetical protein